jgi:hypothetical protein
MRHIGSKKGALMSEQNPLEGLTAAQADEHIRYYEDKVEHAEENARAMKTALKELKQARKNLPAIQSSDSDNGTRVDAESAESRVNE